MNTEKILKNTAAISLNDVAAARENDFRDYSQWLNKAYRINNRDKKSGAGGCYRYHYS